MADQEIHVEGLGTQTKSGRQADAVKVIARWCPVAVGVVTVVLFMVMLIQGSNLDPGLLFSARAAIADMFSAYVVLFPVLCGVAATDALLLRRRGIGSGRHAMIRVLGIWAASAIATLVACFVACVVAATHGSRITVMAFMLVPVMLVGMAAFISIGYALGFWLRSWVVPPVVAVLGYLRPQAGILRFIDIYNCASAPWSVVQHPAGVLCLAVVSLLLLMMATALVWLNAARVLARKIVAGALTLVCFACFFLTQPVMASNSTAWVDDDHSSWPCQVIDAGMRVCAPSEIPGDMALAVAQLTPLVPHLVMLDPGLADARFIPGAPAAGELLYALPMGQNHSTWDQAQSVASGIGAACVAKWLGGPDQVMLVITQDQLIVAVWLAGDATPPYLQLQQPVSLDRARAAYDRLNACNY